MKTYQIPPGGTVYMFQAAFLCEACGKLARTRIDEHGIPPENPEDEATYDSSSYPKGPYQAEELEMCDSMDRCLNLQEEGLR